MGFRLLALTALLFVAGTVNASIAAGLAYLQTPPLWNSADTYQPGNLVMASNGNYYRSIKTSLNKVPTADPHAYWELFYVRANTTLSIGTKATFANLAQAWGFAAPCSIAAGSTLTFGITTIYGNHTENLTSGFVLNHPAGGQMSLRGDNSSKVIFNFSDRSNGFVLSNGCKFDGITGITIQNATTNPQSAGILLESGSKLLNAAPVIKKFSLGMLIEDGSYAGVQSIHISGWSTYGIAIAEHSYVNCGFSNLDGKGLGSAGIAADSGSTVECQGIQISNCVNFGITAQNNSTVDAANTTVTGTNTAYQSVLWAHVNCSFSTVNNCMIAGQAQQGGHMYAHGMTITNTPTSFSPAANTATSDETYINTN